MNKMINVKAVRACGSFIKVAYEHQSQPTVVKHIEFKMIVFLPNGELNACICICSILTYKVYIAWMLPKKIYPLLVQNHC